MGSESKEQVLYDKREGDAYESKIKAVAGRLRAGQVNINGGGGDMTAPFGGYKMSGNGREWGDYGFAEFLETKAIQGLEQAPAAAAE